MHAILVTVSAGLFGLIGPAILARVVAPLLRGQPRSPFGEHTGLVVLIPAHDEAGTIVETIRSVQAAASAGGGAARVVVGADSCGDATARLAREAGAQVREFAFRSKWKTIVALLSEAGVSDWVALVDAGAKWPESLLLDLREILRKPGTLGVAPAYFPRRSSFVERALWRSEAFWKRGENATGGPVSVHGATVFYRAAVLRAALAFLAKFGKDSWLNDDVVIPYSARIAFPGCSLEYWCPRETSRRVSDGGLREGAPQAARRARMVAGNLEWMLTVFPWSARHAPRVALVASRRVLRVFWAYWLLLVLYGSCLAIVGSSAHAIGGTAAVAMAGAAVLALAGKRGIVDAGVASLLAPFLAVAVMRGRKSAWG